MSELHKKISTAGSSRFGGVRSPAHTPTMLDTFSGIDPSLAHLLSAHLATFPDWNRKTYDHEAQVVHYFLLNGYFVIPLVCQMKGGKYSYVHAN